MRSPVDRLLISVLQRSPMLADTLLTGFSAVVIIALIVGLIYWRTRKH